MMDLLQRIKNSRSLGDCYAAVGKHAPGFDTLRVLAAGTVVFHHSMGLQHDIVRDDWLFAVSRDYTTIGFLAVCVFFCISGFLVTPGLLKSGDVLGFVSRRFMRIMPLLIVIVLATVFILGPVATRLPLGEYFTDARTWLYLKNITTSLSLELPGIVNQSGGNKVNGAMWTLRYEWLCYLLLAGLALIGVLRVRSVTVALWVAALAITTIYYQGQAVPDGRWVVLCHLFGYFGAGVLLWLYREAVPVSPLLGIAALAALVAAWATGTGTIFAPALTAYLVAVLGLVRWPWSDWLARADVSYGLYLLHGPTIVLLLAFWTPASFFHLFLATMAVAIPLALLSWHFLEKPALAHKDLFAQLARGAYGLTRRARP